MKTQTALAGLVLLFAADALADACPPSSNDFNTWGWLRGTQSGDDWMTEVVCDSPATRNAIRDMVVQRLGLDENWDYWEDIIADVPDCDPNTWAARTVNGGYAVEYVGIHRDNDTFTHFATATGILPGGEVVTHWLTQYVDFYISEEGYDWECLGDDDEPGGADGFLFASNPSSNSACTFYFPWFWNKTVMDRASTVVHEATHEFSGHVDDDACSNGASCDSSFMAANSQTFQILFDAQSVDAYQREAGSRELKVVNFGADVCGYLPLLPDGQRFAQVAVMQSKLNNCFESTPAQSAWPTAAFIDEVSGTIYDIVARPNGVAGTAYRIDMTNQSRWPCGKVCNTADFTWNANGTGGPRACNEQWQPGNAQVNADNRQHCRDLNAQVNAGVTPAERSSLLAQAANTMRPCIPGVSEQYIAHVCDQVMIGADHVDDIENAWPLADNIGYGYDAEEAIRGCQTRFCRTQPIDAWNGEAFDACFEWDDPAGCMPLACGDLEAIADSKGRDSFEYLNALVCRASELGRNIDALEAEAPICDRVFDECWIRENYLPLWQAQLAGGECWSEGVQNLGDPLAIGRRLAVGTIDANRYVVSDQGVGLLRSECAMQKQECDALQASLAALHAKIARMNAGGRPAWRVPPLPDPWERLDGRYDREVLVEAAALGEQIMQPIGFADVPLSRNGRLLRLVNRPEARVALAELVGQDLYLSTGGARFAAGTFAPDRIARYSGPDAARDTHGLATDGFEDEVAALQMLAARVESREWQALMARAGELDGATYYTHLEALLGARDGVELLAAHDELQTDLQALRR